MDQTIVLLIAVANSVALLILISLGLAIIFGMMRVINFAHGEFIMLGGYATVLAANHGVNLWLAMLVVAPVAVGLVGFVVERVIIRPLYGQIITTMLATWGLSIFLIGAVTTIFGNTMLGVSAPLGNIPIGIYSVSVYQLVLIAITAALVAACLYVLNRTRWGLIARGTVQNPTMASAIGIDPARVYAMTFMAGAALSGLAGGLLAPLSGVIPQMGTAYIADAFVTVISGGSAMIVGTLSASAILGPTQAILSYAATPVIGEAALLLLAVGLLRVLPRGISGLWQGGR
jgi:branched-chain amino acid transport system permease protein